jgi:16S rRNA G527 N7-methylase RsmG
MKINDVKDMLKNELIEYFQSIKVLSDSNVDDETLEKLIYQISAYHETLSAWNEKVNITRDDSFDSFLSHHLGDALFSYATLLKFHQKQGKNLYRILDAGCGGGFIGIFWAILTKVLKLPFSIEVTLLDSHRKRLSFCRQVAQKTGVHEEVKISHQRIEDCTESFDIAVSRATWGFMGFHNLTFSHINRPGMMVYIGRAENEAEMKKNEADYHVFDNENSQVFQPIAYWTKEWGIND